MTVTLVGPNELLLIRNGKDKPVVLRPAGVDKAKNQVEHDSWQTEFSFRHYSEAEIQQVKTQVEAIDDFDKAVAWLRRGR